MAAIVRRSFYEILQEFMRRVGRGTAGTDAVWEARGQQYITAVYLEVAARFYHPEIETEAALSLTAGNLTVALPADCWADRAVFVKDGSGNYTKPLHNKHVHAIATLYQSTAGEPTAYCRLGPNLMVDRKPSSTTTLALFYAKQPVAPDFSSGSPVNSALGRVWDEPILNWAVGRALLSIWEMQIGPASIALGEQFAGAIPQPSQRDQPVSMLPGRSTKPLGDVRP